MASSTQLNFPLKPYPITTNLHSSMLPPPPSPNISSSRRRSTTTQRTPLTSISISCSSSTSSTRRIIKNPSLDRHVVKQNKVRFVQKLKTLILSKPKHYIQLQHLYKCRSYLSLPRPKSILSMIHRYPTIFHLFRIPSSSVYEDPLCVRLTPKAQALAAQETQLKSTVSVALAVKLQKLLMLSSHHRLLLSKLVHLAPDLGLPPNFRSRLCNSYPERFKTVDTSYGRALELVSWEPELAVPLPPLVPKTPDMIVERPLKFKHLRLRKGLNLKRKHRDFLIRFGEMPEVSPYNENVGEFGLRKDSLEAEKRGCGVVREILGMTVEKRTLVDHITHFRKEFGLSNKVRGMIVRHPELFYVSLKGQRDSVFLMEAYDDEGGLLEKDELLGVKERLMELVKEGKWMRRERRKNGEFDLYDGLDDDADDDGVDVEEGNEEEEEDDDGFEGLFEDDEWEDYGVEDDEEGEVVGDRADGEFWTVEASSIKGEDRTKLVDAW